MIFFQFEKLPSKSASEKKSYIWSLAETIRRLQQADKQFYLNQKTFLDLNHWSRTGLVQSSHIGDVFYRLVPRSTTYPALTVSSTSEPVPAVLGKVGGVTPWTSWELIALPHTAAFLSSQNRWTHTLGTLLHATGLLFFCKFVFQLFI